MNNNSSILNIAIDGPAGSGKSTAAKKLAEALGIDIKSETQFEDAGGFESFESKIKEGTETLHDYSDEFFESEEKEAYNDGSDESVEADDDGIVYLDDSSED